MATSHPVQHVTRAFARLGHRSPLWVLATAGVGVQLFYFALGPLGRFSEEPLQLRYPVSEESGFAVGPKGETAIASAFYGHVQVYDDGGRVKGILRLPLQPDESPLAFDSEGNLYACTQAGIEVFDTQLQRVGGVPSDAKGREGIWKLDAPRTPVFHPFGCPKRETLREARGPIGVGGALFLVTEKAGKASARPLGDPSRCVTADGCEGTWNSWLARVDLRATDGTSWSVGTPAALVPFTLIWPGFFWWALAIGMGWAALARRGAKEDPREARRRQLVS